VGSASVAKDKASHKVLKARLPIDLVKRVKAYQHQRRLDSRREAVEELLNKALPMPENPDPKRRNERS
jgi:hypothetical protein